ncbi:MAG: hypothetical protein BMS9Abin36_1028 [Gammaproteobacteria bacterium]|nr:MAG: hypothetical protein BMS9Abin36_1028 [Gammaproteobacteria bacterium]
MSTTTQNLAPVSEQAGFSWWDKLFFSGRTQLIPIRIHDKPVVVELSPAAQKALARRDTPLTAELMLYFSCNIVKKIRFYQTTPEDRDMVPITDKLQVFFNPVIKRACNTEELFAHSVPYSDFEVIDEPRFTPKRVTIHYKNGEWSGEFRL